MTKHGGSRKRKSDRTLLLGDRSFFEAKMLQEMAQAQGLGPVKDTSAFAGGIPDDEDVDEMLEEIHRMREP
jgi:hypothetical protein